MKNIIIIIMLVLVFNFVKPFFAPAPPADSINQCIQTKAFPKDAAPSDQLKHAETELQICKYALELNSKKYTDSNLKNMTTADITSPALLADPQKMANIRESIGILDRIKLHSVMLAMVKNRKLNDKAGAVKTLEDAKAIVSQYKFYDETSQSSSMLDSSIQRVSSGQ